MMSLPGLKIVIATHVFATGPAQALTEFLRDKVKKPKLLSNEVYER